MDMFTILAFSAIIAVMGYSFIIVIAVFVIVAFVMLLNAILSMFE